ncbi:hypothetical protein EYF80_049717 [Liparis tanakae]|uniref:Uncharacterized protein n=1 Tax=Liparis tanakae TaxID=230148 RepID=A0A4Z2FH64_9TELE|nr:hypothetical protein EYF80_049717 [Liparis tanakae]
MQHNQSHADGWESDYNQSACRRTDEWPGVQNTSAHHLEDCSLVYSTMGVKHRPTGSSKVTLRVEDSPVNHSGGGAGRIYRSGFPLKPNRHSLFSRCHRLPLIQSKDCSPLTSMDLWFQNNQTEAQLPCSHDDNNSMAKLVTSTLDVAGRQAAQATPTPVAQRVGHIKSFQTAHWGERVGYRILQQQVHMDAADGSVLVSPSSQSRSMQKYPPNTVLHTCLGDRVSFILKAKCM